MSDSSNHKFATRAVHAGQKPDPSTGAIMTPVYMTSTFVQKSPGVIVEDYDYSRSANPTRKALEANLASLEGGRFGFAFSSGLAAMDCVMHLLSAGDHIILGDDVYGGTFRLVDKVYKQLGITATRVDFTNHAALQTAFTPKTKLVWGETPTNPMLRLCDIAAVSKIAKARNAMFVVDNTFATPYLQNPLALGADVVHHSSTKYIGGHSDVIGGALVTSDEQIAAKLKFFQNSVGGVPGPMDCFMLLRSTKTLHVRMERHCANAMKVAEFLAGHKAIASVAYPGLKSHPEHALASKQMRGFGGMITATLKGGMNESRRFLERVHLFSLAESLGGVESLIEHPAIMTHASIPAENRAALGITDGLVRLSVGIEDADDLIRDLEHALGQGG
ncbi:MAG TPA: cystathionine gamma-synthase [Phycisphaerales bacterium]|nr:cystathionine gamma-synthase [Phycisphaerales bacterium]